MRRSSAFLLTFGIIAFFLANNANFFFRRPYYEFWDLAANSLSIERAKHFKQLYGPYSRYLFNHPGPAFFYVFAAGEALFYDTLHLVPSPFQGQLLLNLLLVTGLYVASLNMFAAWLPAGRRWIFVCAALFLGILHFGTMHNLSSLFDPLGGPSAFLSVWSGHSVVLPFLCLLAAGASVGAGRGRDLPWMILAGGLLLEHISEAFFVGSIGVAAYLGLLVRCHARERAAAAPNLRRRWWLAAWREHPRAHGLAGLLLAGLLLPMVIDLTLGRNSNFAAILRHMHTEQAGDRKPLVRSLAYFLQYGAYAPYKFNANYFGYYDLPGFLAYVRAHALLYAGWALVLLLMLQAPFAYLWTLLLRRRRARAAAVPPADAAALDAALGTRRFLAWTALVGAISLALALYWGTRQDGKMYYFNAYSNFAIYYFGLLGAVAVLCTVGLGRPGVPAADAPGTGSDPAPPRWRRWPVAPLAGAGVVLLTAVLFAGRLRIHDDYGSAETRGMHRNVERAIAESDANHPTACKVLYVPDDHWPVSVSVGLQLVRAGEPFIVTGPRWKNTFGRQFDWNTLTPDTLRGGLCPWYVVSPGATVPGTPDDTPSIPLRKDAAGVVAALVMRPPDLEFPASGRPFEMDFSPDGKGSQYTLGGFARPDPSGTWTEESMAALAFLPPPIQGSGVEVSVEAMPFLSPAHGVSRQRMRLYFNGTLLSPEQEFTNFGTVRFTVPAALWNTAAANAAPVASLAFELPDAVVPATWERGNPGGDPRKLGLFIHWLHLRVLP